MSRGVVPFRPVVEGLEDRIVPYALSGYQWGTTTITASYLPDGTTTQTGNPSNLFATLNASHSTATWQRELARALQTWANSSRLNFHFVADSGNPSGSVDGSNGDIRLAMSARSDTAAGRAYYPTGSSLAGDVFLSSNYTWYVGQHLDLYSVTLHELGHSLGLGHSAVSGSIMAPTIGTVYSGLSADDVAGIQAIYGARQNDSYDSGSGNDSFGNASAINLNGSGAATFNADLTSMGDVDHYKFTAPANSNGSLTVSVDATGISLLNPKVSVYDAAFNLIGSATASSYGGKATANLNGLVAGQTYYVVADGGTSDEFGMGAYKLTAEFGLGAAQQPRVSVGNVSLTEGNSGTKQFNFTVSLSAAGASTVTVNYATANGSATAGSDYTATSGTVTFAPGETSKTVTVNVNGDTVVEGEETFAVDLSSATNATIGTSRGTGTIQNDDVPTVSVGNVAINEGNSGTTQFTFTVSLSAASASTVTVQYATANGTASSASDYAATSGTVTFAPGETQKTVTVNVNGDTAVESNETFAVNLTSPTNATLGASQGTGTIQNDDSPTVSIGNVATTEGNSGTKQFNFTVTLSAASASTVTVNYATANGSATAGSDYTATSGTVTFAPGETQKTVTVLVAGETLVESDETFVVDLNSPTNATLGTSQGTGTIQNDDATVVSINNVAITEGSSGTKQLAFTVTLSAASASTVTVQYATANGTATAGSDYTATSGTISFAPGETQKTVTVDVLSDSLGEVHETFAVVLSSPTNATIGTSQGTGTIQNDDAVRDRFESNDRPKDAKNFGKNTGFASGNLSLHRASDLDFYSFTPTRSRTFDITITPTQGSGRTDVAILNAARTQIASGTSQTGSVTVTTALQGGQKYYVQVTSASGSVFTYSLNVAKVTAAGLQITPGSTPQVPAGAPAVADESSRRERVQPEREFGAGKRPKVQKTKDAGDNVFFNPAGDTTLGGAAASGDADERPLDTSCGCAMCSGSLLIPEPLVS